MVFKWIEMLMIYNSLQCKIEVFTVIYNAKSTLSE